MAFHSILSWNNSFLGTEELETNYYWLHIWKIVISKNRVYGVDGVNKAE